LHCSGSTIYTLAFLRKGRTRSETSFEETEFLNTEYNPSKHNLNVVIVDCSYMFQLLQSDHHHAVYQKCKKGNYFTYRYWRRSLPQTILKEISASNHIGGDLCLKLYWRRSLPQTIFVNFIICLFGIFVCVSKQRLNQKYHWLI
jgi:hypothetical protein